MKIELWPLARITPYERNPRIPTHYYAALSERMLTDGFFARTLIVESGPRGVGQEPGIINPPPRVLETVRWWSEFSPGRGNLERFHPVLRVVEADDEARNLLTESRQASEAEYASAEARGDPVGTTVWGRVPEQIRKRALLSAVSANHESPQIDSAAVRWATDFILHQTRRMLFMAQSHVADNPFHADCLKLLRKLRSRRCPTSDRTVGTGSSSSTRTTTARSAPTTTASRRRMVNDDTTARKGVGGGQISGGFGSRTTPPTRVFFGNVR
ncbi:MAG: hypothetical protein WEB58_16935 [Planctomycetaceae bacterium]